MEIRHFIFLIISITCCQFQSTAQNKNLIDLTFEQKVKGSNLNEPIDLEIKVINNGNTSAPASILSIDATFQSVSEADIKRLKLELVDSDYIYQIYRINRDIPALKPNETAVINFKLDGIYTDETSFLIQIDRENQLKELNRNNNKICFPETEAVNYKLLPDMVVKKILRPHYDAENENTVLEFEIENIGHATAQNVTINTWEIITVLNEIPERDLKALLGENWWVFNEQTFEPMFDIYEGLGDIKAGVVKNVLIGFDGWVYNPNCKIGVEVTTASQELNTDNNSQSFLKGG